MGALSQVGEQSFVDVKVVTAIVAALISLLSACVAIYFNHQSRKTALISVRIARFNAQQSERTRLLSWGKEAMDAISSCYIHLLTPTSEQFSSQKRDCLARITSLIDQGRWLLPNHEHVSYGKDKESAYTGFRQAALDDLVDVFKILISIDQKSDLNDAASQVMKSKRRFTSAIQEKIEPRAVEADLKNLGDSLK